MITGVLDEYTREDWCLLAQTFRKAPRHPLFVCREHILWKGEFHTVETGAWFLPPTCAALASHDVLDCWTSLRANSHFIRHLQNWWIYIPQSWLLAGEHLNDHTWPFDGIQAHLHLHPTAHLLYWWLKPVSYPKSDQHIIICVHGDTIIQVVNVLWQVWIDMFADSFGNYATSANVHCGQS